MKSESIGGLRTLWQHSSTGKEGNRTIRSKMTIVEETADGLGWKVTWGSQTDSKGLPEFYVEFRKYTDAGEDYGFTEFYNRVDQIPDLVLERYRDFDVEEHVHMWLDAKENGYKNVPGVIELVEDAKNIELRLWDLAISLRNKLREANNG